MARERSAARFVARFTARFTHECSILRIDNSVAILSFGDNQRRRGGLVEPRLRSRLQSKQRHGLNKRGQCNNTASSSEWLPSPAGEMMTHLLRSMHCGWLQLLCCMGVREDPGVVGVDLDRRPPARRLKMQCGEVF